MIYGGSDFNFSSFSNIWNNLRERKDSETQGYETKVQIWGKRKKKLNMTIFFRFVLITSSKKTLFDIVRVRRLLEGY